MRGDGRPAIGAPSGQSAGVLVGVIDGTDVAGVAVGVPGVGVIVTVGVGVPQPSQSARLSPPQPVTVSIAPNVAITNPSRTRMARR